jgi:3-oxoacyl-[acyl-carrier protein] reductase
MTRLLEGITALVTGVADPGGIGFGVAKVLGQKGAHLAIVDISPQVHDRAAALREEGFRVASAMADLTSCEQVGAVVEDASAAIGPVDVLVNVAGIAALGSTPDFVPVVDMTQGAWERGLAINLTTQFNCVRAVLPGMAARSYGRIVNMCSVTGPVVASPCMAAYAAAKGGVLGFTRAIALESGRHGVTANAVAPGWIRTGAMTPAMEIAGENTPVGRCGEPAEVGHLVAFLASAEASYITGQLFVIDGGNTIQEYKGPGELFE